MMSAQGPSVDDDRGRLRQLSARLLALHRVLLAWARGTHEAEYGPVAAADLLQLLLRDERFAWLRSLSGMIARIDAALDDELPLTSITVEGFGREAHQLLRSGGASAFATRYAEALQDSPDVVIAHADVVKLLPRPGQEKRGG